MKNKSQNRGPFDIILFWDVLVMTVFGLIMIFSASAPSAFTKYGNSFYFAGKQMIWAVAGIAAMFFCANFDYRNYKKLAFPMYVVNLILLLIVLFAGMERNGAKRWINFGFSTLQPSEFTKIVVVVCVAYYFELLGNTKQTMKNIYIPLALIIAVPCVLIMKQPHFSAVIIIGSTSVAMMVAYGVKLKFYLPGFVIGPPLAFWAIYTEPYRLKRILSFLDPFADKQGDGWQVCQSLYAIASGGLFGLGLTRSRQKYMYIPEPQNDFIYAIICEELGLIGGLFVIFLFAVLLWRCIVIALNCKDNFGTLLAFGLGILTCVQAFLNIAVATSFVPPTGVPLPFFSAGGSSFVFQMVSIGIILSVSRYKDA